MSQPRRLWIRFRRVDRSQESAYRKAVSEAGATADASGSHFWAFSLDGDPGRFVEFLEGPRDAALELLDQRTSESLAASGPLEEAGVRTDGARCTELRDEG